MSRWMEDGWIDGEWINSGWMEGLFNGEIKA
jgi:hypothetical protein